MIPHGEANVSTNRAQRRLRAISDEHCDDTAVEMDCVEAAHHTYRLTRAALLDGMVTSSEAQEIVDALAATVRLAEDSLRRNVAVEQKLTAFSHDLSTGPAVSYAA
jgi:hypothetical protein